MKSSDVKVGMLVKVTAYGGSHDYPIGMVGKVLSRKNDGSGIKLAYVSGPEQHDGNFITSELFQLTVPFDRKAQAKLIEEEELPSLEAEAAALDAKIKETEANIHRLQAFDSEEDEVAHVISSVISSKGSAEGIAKALKVTNILRLTK